MNRSTVVPVSAFALAFVTSAVLGQATDRSIFICNNGNLEGSVTSMKVANNGTLTFVHKLITGVDPDPGKNAQCIGISPNGQFLATGHGTINDVVEQLTFIRVNADGTLTQVAEFTTPDSPLDLMWLTDEYIAVLQTDSPSLVHVYDFDPAGPTLTLIDTEGSGSFSSTVEVDRAHSLFYTQSSSGTTVTCFRYGLDGELTLIETLSTGGTYPLGIGVSPDGTKLYGGGGISNSGNKIIGMSVDTATGDLTNMATTPFVSPGSSPKQVVVSLDGRFAIAAHGTDATFRSFTIDQGTGALTSTGFSYDIGFQGSLGELAVMADPNVARGGFTPSGTLIVVTDRDTINDGVRGVRSFSLGDDGSFNQNGTIVDTQGVAPNYIAVWDPPALFCATDLTDNSGGGPDGQVDVFDLFLLLANWSMDGPGANIAPPTDVVDVFDLFVMLDDWGKCAP